MGNTSSTHMGNTYMIGSSNVGVGWHRVGVRFAKASVASLSEADPNAMRAGFVLVDPSPERGTSSAPPTQTRIPGWPHPAWIGFPHFPDQQAGKINRAFFRAHQLEAHRIPNQRLADKPPAPSPFDLPVAPDMAHRPTARVSQRHTSIPPWLRTINLRGRPLPQSLVWTNFVVDLGPSIRPPLLSPQMARSGVRRLGLEHPMHLFVRTILFWMPWRCELYSNLQSRPPGTQARKPSRTHGSERSTVVHPDGGGVSILPEQSQENPTNQPPTLNLQQTGGQQITTEHIPHRQRFHPLAVLRSKPTLEIHRPDLVAATSDCQSSGPQLPPPTRTAVHTAIQFHSLQPLADRPRTGNSLTWIFFAQPSSKLPAPPTPMASAQPPNPGLPLRRHSTRRAMRSPRSISQSAPSLPLEPGLPFVAQLATESEQPTQLRHALLGL